jgi:hypothetical protein
VVKITEIFAIAAVAVVAKIENAIIKINIFNEVLWRKASTEN